MVTGYLPSLFYQRILKRKSATNPNPLSPSIPAQTQQSFQHAVDLKTLRHQCMNV
jgi:hypothetical protein